MGLELIHQPDLLPNEHQYKVQLVSAFIVYGQELKEQFAAYRRDKGENEAITGQLIETLRQEASALRMDNVKITAKVSGRSTVMRVMYMYVESTYSLEESNVMFLSAVRKT